MTNYKTALGNYKPDQSGGETFARVVKKSDETVNNSTTLQDDDELVVAVNANKTYHWVLTMIGQSKTTTDLKWIFVVPSGASCIESAGTAIDNFNSRRDATGLQNCAIPTDDVPHFLRKHGRLIIVSTAGNFQLQFAQETAGASDCKMLEGSSLVLYEEKA